MPDTPRRILDVDLGQSIDEIVKADPWISAENRWSAEMWRFDGHIPGHLPYTITWDFEAPQGMLEKLKYLTACEFIRPDGRTADKKFTGTKNFRIGIRYLARFMARKGITEFSELTPSVFRAFKRGLGDSLQATAVDPDADELETDLDDAASIDIERQIAEAADAQDRGGDGSAPSADAVDDPAQPLGEEGADDEGDRDEPDADDAEEVEIDGLTFSVARIRLEAWQFLVNQRDRLARAGIDPIGFDPFASTSVNNMAHKVSTVALKQVEAIPDDVVNPILREAYRLLGQPAEDVIRLQRRFLDVRAAAADTKEASPTASLRRCMSRAKFETLEGEASPWRGPIDLSDYRATGAEELTDLIETVRNAAVIVLIAGVGWRISEACSPEVEERRSNGALPSCVFTTRSLTGTSDHFWIKGKLSKMRKESDPEEWLLGARLRGSSVEPPTVRAVRVLERLLDPYRRIATDPFTRRQLLVRFRDNKAMPTSGDDVVPILGEVVRRATRKFIVERCSVRASTSGLIENLPRLRPYHDSDGANIKLHQWRHTYYQMLIRIDPDLQPALSDHFKHADMAMTESAYGAKRRDVEDARRRAMLENSVDFFARRRGTTAIPKAHVDKAMQAGRKALEERLADFGLAEDEEAIEALCISHDLRVYPAEHGSCLVSLNPDEARCHRREGLIDWRADSPNYASRTPSLCTGCKNFSVGQENVPFWRRRYVEYRSSWVSSGRHPSFRFALQRSIQAAAVLRSLDQPVPVILVKERPKEKSI